MEDDKIPVTGQGDELREPDREVPGYPAPPEIVAFSQARGNRRAAIRVRLDALEENGPDKFAHRVMQRLANALGTLNEALNDLKPDSDLDGLHTAAKALEEFSFEPEDARSNRSFWEKLNGRPAPRSTLLKQLEMLNQSLPVYNDRQEPSWKELQAAYERVHTLSIELGDSVSAGKSRMAKSNADLKPAHDSALEARPENRGPEAETALQALRAARDSVERRVHALRGAHLRATRLLTEVRDMAECYLELRRQRKYIDARARPAWETALDAFVNADDLDATDTGEADALIQANKDLKSHFESAAEAGRRLLDAYSRAKSGMESGSEGRSVG